MAVTAPTRSLATARRHEVRIDASKPLKAEPNTGHNRWHPDIAPILRVDPGDEVILETRDALDGQLTPDSRSSDAGSVNLNVVHPLTGPVYVNGAEPGDLLEVKILEVEPADAIPGGTIGGEALRTVPPRETAGNVDIKQLCAGTTMLIPIHAEGALFSVGDAHFAQGDGEICGTAIEMRSVFHAQFFVRK